MSRFRSPTRWPRRMSRSRPVRSGASRGRPGGFRLEGAVPAEWAGRRVEVVIDPGFTDDGPGFQAEGLVYDAHGVPLKGIHPRNRHIPVASPADGGEPVRLLLEAAANPSVLRDGFAPTPLGDVLTAGDRPLYRFASADVAVLDEDVWHLVLDIEVLSELMRELPADRPRRHEILRALENALDALDLHDVPATAAAARAELAGVLERPAHASAHRVSAAGHAHIDSAWLWPLRETVRKASRTFANVTALAGDYPELVFACSQAQQYAWVKEHQPHIWERIKKAVAEGNWAPVGSMWVESDANMPGGEALARQIVHGKRFFVEELGVDTEEIWLPDSFGYTAAFPQLAKLAGVKWFLTQKLSWNQSNKMPHHTFWWEGIDGTRVFTHFPPVDTYNAQFSAAELAHAEKNFRRQGPRHPLTGPLRLGRRRGRPHPGDAGEGAPAGLPGGLAEGRDPQAVGVLHGGGAGVRGQGAGVVGRAVSGAAPGHVHHPGGHQAGQPAQRTPAAGGRVVGHGRRAPRARVRLSVRRPGPNLEDGTAAPVP
ncbi:alpha-mannosidase 2C1 [Streptomyces himastatinicus ATCC 53653]|uniref:Alpha-mannosidase 2C1 n=1 Tax=Streptomyces himastatinicus ATCC 53653 TaxID=457427 RepID=D9W6F1_9ACTN|nr:alpha-mannosidase 2C1 [Streptomyces himastatinicus ATCC 53653]